MAERRNTEMPPRMLRTQEAARFLGISLRTLEKHRTYGTGPTYRKIGGRVLYTVDDLQSWADIGARKSTSDEGARSFRRAPRRLKSGASSECGASTTLTACAEKAVASAATSIPSSSQPAMPVRATNAI